MEHVRLRFEGGVESVTLDRPEVRCVALAGHCTAFRAGAGLDWMPHMAGYTRDQNLEDACGSRACSRWSSTGRATRVAKASGPSRASASPTGSRGPEL